MRIRLFPLVCVASLLFTSEIFSMPLHLEDAEKLAMERNLERIVRQIEMQQAQAGETTASLRANPTLEIDNITASPQNRSMGGSLTIPIDLSGRRSYRMRFAQETTKSLRMDYRNAMRLLLRDVRSAYYDLLEAREKEGIAGESEITYRQLAELNQARLHEQQISVSEASRSLIAWKQARLRRDESVLSAVRAREALRSLIGITDEIELADELAPASLDRPPALEQVLEHVDQRPDLLSLRLRREATRADLELQKAKAYPDFSLGLTARYGGNSYMAGSPIGYPFTIYHNDEVGLFAQLSLPVFDRNQGEVSRAELETRKVNEIIEKTRVRVISEIRTAYSEYESARHALQEFGDEGEASILSRAGKSVESARFAYRNGGISLLEYLDAVNVYAEIRTGYVSAISRFNRSRAALDAASAYYNEDKE